MVNNQFLPPSFSLSLTISLSLLSLCPFPASRSLDFIGFRRRPTSLTDTRGEENGAMLTTISTINTHYQSHNYIRVVARGSKCFSRSSITVKNHVFHILDRTWIFMVTTKKMQKLVEGNCRVGTENTFLSTFHPSPLFSPPISSLLPRRFLNSQGCESIKIFWQAYEEQVLEICVHGYSPSIKLIRSEFWDSNNHFSRMPGVWLLTADQPRMKFKKCK